MNLNANRQQNKKVEPTQTPIIVEVERPSDNTNSSNIATPDPEVCREEIGPLEISSPEESELVEDDHVCINIAYNDERYCSVVWSYRINGGTWSEYNSNSPCLYNIPDGDVKFELRVQSTVSRDTEILERNFTYKQATPEASTSEDAGE